MNIGLALGYALMLAGFVLIGLIGYGVIEPFGAWSSARNLGELMSAALPSFLVPAALFVGGLLLVKRARRR